MNVVDKIKAWNENRTFANKWRNRNYDNVAVFLDTFNHPYWNFQQDYFMENSQELIDRLETIGFDMVPPYKLKEDIKDPFSFICTTFINDKHNVVVRLVGHTDMPHLKTALKIVKGLQVVEDRISLTDVFVTSIKSFYTTEN